MADDNLQDFAIVCDHVFRKERPVRVVARYRDLSWQMTCGGTDHREDGEGAEVVHVGHLFDRQEDLEPFRDLQPGMMADWVDGRWEVMAHDD
jgi:hypothetical protein